MIPISPQSNEFLVIEKHLVVSCPQQTIIEFLALNCPLITKQKLKKALSYGAVWLTSQNKTVRVRRAKKILNQGDEVHLYYNEQTLFGEITPATLISDEIEFSVWNKPCGMFSQGTKWGDHSSICRWIELNGLALNHLAQREVYLVHRLDRATNGLILVAHSKKMANILARLFESRQIEKRYKALVNGNCKLATEDQRMTDPIDGKQASTLLLESIYDESKNQSCLLLQLETGRKHQIRKHLSNLGFPIIGDRQYGDLGDLNIDSDKIPDLQLQSCYLGFKSPLDGKYLSFQI